MRFPPKKNPVTPGKASYQAPEKTHSGVSLNTGSPEIRIGLEAAKPYKSPTKDKGAADAKKVKTDEKKITMPGKPARIPARRSVRK